MGDGNPLTAIEDALAIFPADELLIATLPPERSHWIERDLVGHACARFGLPTFHLVVETAGDLATLHPVAA